MLIQALKAVRTRFFGINKGDNQLARLADINPVIDQVNAMSYGKPLSFYYTITDGETVDMVVVGVGCKCADCAPKNCSGCAPANTSSFYKCGSVSAALTNTDSGSYVIDLDPNFDYSNIYLRIGNLATAGSSVGVTKVDDVTFNLSVVNGSGVASDGELDGAFVEILVFPVI